jgi:hypothetical protein
VWLGEVDVGACRHQPGGIDVAVAPVVVVNDVPHVHRLLDARKLIQLLRVVPQIGVLVDGSPVALKVGLIDFKYYFVKSPNI